MSDTNVAVAEFGKKLPIKPLLNFVLIEREKIESKAGIIIPEAAQQRNAPSRGVILAAGPDCTDDIKNSIGKNCFFADFAGRRLLPFSRDEKEQNLFVVTDEDIIGIGE